jgi:hypothetical protein
MHRASTFRSLKPHGSICAGQTCWAFDTAVLRLLTEGGAYPSLRDVAQLVGNPNP